MHMSKEVIIDNNIFLEIIFQKCILITFQLVVDKNRPDFFLIHQNTLRNIYFKENR